MISSIASDSFKGVDDIKGGFAKAFKSGCVSGLWVSATTSGIVVSSIADVAANVDAPWALASSLWGIEVSTKSGNRVCMPPIIHNGHTPELSARGPLIFFGKPLTLRISLSVFHGISSAPAH